MSIVRSIGGKEFTVGNSLTIRSFNTLAGMLGNYRELFLVNLSEYTVNNLSLGRIDIGNRPPFYKRSNLNDHENDLLEGKVNELLASGHLKWSNSPFSSPVRPRFINGKLEICVDYGRLNQITIKMCNCITPPSVQTVIGSIDRATWFTKIVILDAFHQMRLDEDSREKTAFETDFGHFEFKTYHHGLKHASTALQNLMEHVLDEISEFNVKIYLGQILIHNRSFDDHFETTKQVLRRLRDVNLKVDINESLFFVNELIYLGYYIDSYNIWIPQDKIDKIMSFNQPNHSTDVRSFLGLVSQYKSYITNFDQIAQPLYDLTSQQVAFRWGWLQRDSFNLIKEVISRDCPLVNF